MTSPCRWFVVVVLICCCSEAHSSTLPDPGTAMQSGARREVTNNGWTGSTDPPKTATIFPDEATPSRFFVTSPSKPHATVDETGTNTSPNATNLTTPSNATDIHTTPSSTYTSSPNTTHIYTTPPNATHIYTTPPNATHLYTTPPNATHIYTTPPNATNIYTTSPNATKVYSTTPPNATHIYTSSPNTTDTYTTPIANTTHQYTTPPNTTHVHTTPPNTTQVLPSTTSPTITTRLRTTASPADTTPSPATTIHTTMPAPATTFPTPASGTWFVNQSGEPCLILQAAITVNITYSTSQTADSAVLISLPESAESRGSCGPNSSHITLGLQSGDFNLTFTFDANVTFDGLENAFVLSQVSLGYVLDGSLFPDTSSADAPVVVRYSNFSDTHLAASMGSSFKCDAEQSFHLDRYHVLSISHVQVQPFAVRDGKFSKAETCPQDGKGPQYNLGVAVALGVTIPVVFMGVFIGWHYFCVMRKRGGAKAYSALI
ncbi:LAMP2 [Branchiostoma lanceolatum]|uniref:Lysosome-associated membrane glycoprotein 5 n=1 Tax=Branchiostoma lanceolatum TaxID=7740 RepID=A0A8K0EFZ9_BRALA|nr:LAMP2 [Branchiostoma lanceolatum]